MSDGRARSAPSQGDKPMAIVPIFDDMGNVIEWRDTAPYDNATPPPTTTATTPPPQAPGPKIGTSIGGGGPFTGTPGTPGTVETPPPTAGRPVSGRSGDVAWEPYDPNAPQIPGNPDYNVQPSGGDTPAPPSGGTGGSDYSGGFVWPEFNAPTFDPGPAFVAPPAFSYEPFRYDAFKAPTLDEAKAEPGYEFARSEGLRGLENVAASRGVARTGGTLKDLIGWGNRFAEQNYGNVFNRAGQTYDRNWNAAASTYDRNRNNAADAYQTNYGISRDVFDRDYGQRKDKFGYDYQGAKDMFAPKERAAQATFDDIYRRWKAELDANTSIATAGAGL